MKTFISTLLTLCFSQIALADTTYVCTHGDSQRTIEVVYLSSGTAPCEVRYTKNGFTEVLWSAEVEEGYCDEKAGDFVEKQRGWGWECGESMAAMDNSAASSEVPEWQRLE
ncbi:MAG: hypothetical protein P8X93_04900 [Gammaproteobacteria bacterium]